MTVPAESQECAVDPSLTSRKKKAVSKRAIKQRFWAKVNKDGPAPSHLPELGQCWLWMGATRSAGYGSFSVMGENLSAHRFSWEIHYSRIFDDLNVLHRCDTPLCVRPEHLFLGTKADNHADMDQKGRRHVVRGESSPHAKLTESDVRVIRERIGHGEIARVIAIDYSVTQGVISSIARGKTWRHVQ